MHSAQVFERYRPVVAFDIICYQISPDHHEDIYDITFMSIIIEIFTTPVGNGNSLIELCFSSRLRPQSAE